MRQNLLTANQLAALQKLDPHHTTFDTNTEIGGRVELAGFKPFKAVAKVAAPVIKKAGRIIKSDEVGKVVGGAKGILNSPITAGIVAGVSAITAPIGGGAIAGAYLGAVAGVNAIDQYRKGAIAVVKGADQVGEGIKTVRDIGNRMGFAKRDVQKMESAVKKSGGITGLVDGMRNVAKGVNSSPADAAAASILAGGMAGKVAEAARSVLLADLSEQVEELAERYPELRAKPLKAVLRDKKIPVKLRALALLIYQLAVALDKKELFTIIKKHPNLITPAELKDIGVASAKWDAKWVGKQLERIGDWLDDGRRLSAGQERWLEMFGIDPLQPALTKLWDKDGDHAGPKGVPPLPRGPVKLALDYYEDYFHDLSPAKKVLLIKKWKGTYGRKGSQRYTPGAMTRLVKNVYPNKPDEWIKKLIQNPEALSNRPTANEVASTDPEKRLIQIGRIKRRNWNRAGVDVSKRIPKILEWLKKHPSKKDARLFWFGYLGETNASKQKLASFVDEGPRLLLKQEARAEKKMKRAEQVQAEAKARAKRERKALALNVKYQQESEALAALSDAPRKRRGILVGKGKKSRGRFEWRGPGSEVLIGIDGTAQAGKWAEV